MSTLSLTEDAAALPCLHTMAKRFDVNAERWMALSELFENRYEAFESVHMSYQRKLQMTAFNAICELTNLTDLTVKVKLHELPSISNIRTLSGPTSLELHGFDCLRSVADLSSLPAKCVLGRSTNDAQALPEMQSLQTPHIQYVQYTAMWRQLMCCSS